MDGESIPIACSLRGNQAGRRWREWGDVMGRPLSVDQSPQHLTVRFPTSGVFTTKLGELVAAEWECCGFVAWELEDLGNELILPVRGDPEGVRALAEGFGITP